MTLHIAMLAAECFPYVKVGGLADVVPALSRELGRAGAKVDVVIPAHRAIDFARWGFQRTEPGASRRPSQGGGRPADAVWRATLPDSPVNVYAVGVGDYFERAGVYVDPATRAEYPDQLERWVAFTRAALGLLEIVAPEVDVIHCHDHHVGLAPAYLEAAFRPAGSFTRAATVATLHNLAYQGAYDASRWPALGLDRPFGAGDDCEFYGRINLMKALIMGADALTTVSPSYAREIQTEALGHGLDGCLRFRRRDLHGILNGVDRDVWNPRTDPWIHRRYGVDDLEGKGENRVRVLESFGLDPKLHAGPLLATIGRIEWQKGIDLLLPILDRLLEEEVYFLLLGTGLRELEAEAAAIVRRHPDRAAARFAVDEALAHQVEAAADVFLMPSRFEPCGLNQMYSQLYGTVPVVHATGGLADTVEEYDPATGAGTGFRFASPDPAAFEAAIRRALAVWPDQPAWRRLQANGMARDFTWTASAARYLEVYRGAVQKRRA